MTDIASILAPIKEALETGHDLALAAQQQVSESLAGYLPRKHAAAQNDVDVTAAGLAALGTALAAVEALQAERDALRDSLATEISRSCASERDCIWQPHCAGAGKCLRPERPFDAALSAQTTKEA